MTFQDDDEVVISGIGGKFPEAGNVAELAAKLFAGESLVTKDARKLTKGFYENLPEYNGKTQTNFVLFDNTFFGISTIVSTAMDPLTCQILQRTFEAVIDAGINPSELRGTNTSVFSGTCHSDSDLEWTTDTRSGYGIMGRNRCMNSNRISYWLDLNGHSVSTDSGWTNGLSNLYHGWDAIKSGKCDTAIVSTASLQCHALVTIQFKDFGFLSPDGISRTFDDAANGFGRSSAVVVFVLQRARCARRHYATIGHIHFTCFGDRDENINKPTQKEWEQLFRDFYKKAKIDVNDVHYIEAHGSSLREEDAEELNAITEVFCKNRKSPLLIGCVKSNMGHTEASSSFCGIVKSIISLENGLIPQNLNYKNPNSLCPGLAKGLIKVVDKNTPISPEGWIAVNCHSFGGTYAHITLKANPKVKTLKHDNIPRLVLLADRTNDYMSDLLEKVESVPFDLEFVGLLHEIHSRRVEKYLGRGYTILPAPENPIHENLAYGEEKRPVWFIFSGMGSQWPKMGRRLMDLPIFRESIEKSHKLLETKGLDLIHIITTDDPNIFDNILHSFVGIAAIQIALVDILKALNVNANGFIGHSVGELGCAYADNCFTAEEMLLAAYYRGRASTETELIKGSMAAVGKGYQDIKDKLPEGIEVACHNSEDSCTLSGPVDLIHKFVAELKEQGIFARSVNVSNIAYHSRYIRPAAPKLLAYLKEVVKNPKLRSSKWISTSNPESQWDTEVAKYCSAEYHTNNLLSSVLFEEGSKHIPKNAICIEIAPHGLLQAILKRSLGEDVINIPMTSRSAEDPLIFLLQAIGKMYMAGIDPNIKNLYPKIEYPVSRGTHVLNHLVHWHEQLSATAVTPMEKKIIYSFKSRLVSIADDGTGYIANQQNIYPLSIFLQLAWDIFASLQKKPNDECPVVFQNFRLEHSLPVHLSEEDNVVITFEIGSGKFEIITDHLLASGSVFLLKEKPLDADTRKITKIDLVEDEIYEEIKRKGYGVGEYFKSLTAVSFGENEIMGEIPLKTNWCQSVESLLQLYLLNTECPLGYFLFPRAFERLEISCVEHKKLKNSLSESGNFIVTYDVVTNTATCGGIKIRGLKGLEMPKLKSSLKFPSTNFFPLMNPPLESSLRFADFCFYIVLDNVGAIKNLTVTSIMEVTEPDQSSSIALHLQQLFCNFKVKVKTVTNPTTEMKDVMDFVITPLKSLDKCMDHLIDGGFVLLKTTPNKNIPVGFNLIGRFLENPDEEYLLLKQEKGLREEMEFIVMEGSHIHLINTIKDLKPSEKIIYIVVCKEPAEGVRNFKERMQAESVVKLRWIFILDPKAPKFDCKNAFYAEQLNRGLSTNVYKNGSWGGYCEYNFSESALQDDFNFILEWSEGIKPIYMSFDLREDLLKLQLAEYSGKINNTKVMGIAELVNNRKIVQDKYLTWEIPESWSLEEAASVPISYALAYYCIVIVGKLQKSEKVMVTDGMSCIGQASIAVALTIASRVFVTVNNEKEAAMIKKLFPEVKESDIISHEDIRFDLTWKLYVKSEYCELIINTLEGERFMTMLNCTGQYGRIFHFGKQDARKNVQLGSSIFLMSLALHNKDPETLLRLKNYEKESLHELMLNGIKNGVVKPLPRVVVSFNELKKVQSKATNTNNYIKTLIGVDSVKPNLSYVRFDSSSSYIVIGDETDIWIDITEWLISRSVQNIIVSFRRQSTRSQIRIPHLKKHESVFIYNHEDTGLLIQEAQKLGPISAVYYICMNSSEVSQPLLVLDKSYRNSKSHFLAITKSQGRISTLCTARNNSGFPSTNFIWDADEMLINEHLEFMGKLCGRDSVIHVSSLGSLSTSDRKLIDLLPTSIDDFCDIGSSLEEHVRITPLLTLTGVNRANVKESCPLIFIPDLHKDPVKMLQPVVADFLYPAVCVQTPNMKLSIPQMASFILPEIVKFNKGKVFNLVGISWGTHLAMELAKQLEDIGAIVGVILIEGPFFNAKALVTKSLESDLLNLIRGCSKVGANLEIQKEIISEKTWQGQLNKTLNILNLPPEKEKDFCKAATFVYNNLRALLDHDISTINIKGPLNVLVSGEQSFDDKVIWKLSKSISIRCLPVSSEEIMTSKNLWKIIHGSAITRSMSENTVHYCSWSALEEFMTQKVILKLGHDFQATNRSDKNSMGIRSGRQICLGESRLGTLAFVGLGRTSRLCVYVADLGKVDTLDFASFSNPADAHELRI